MRFYGQWDPPVDSYLFEKFFPTKENGTFIECGAFDGVTESCCKFFEEFRGWTGVNVEPVPRLYELLCSNRPESTNLNLALTDPESTLAPALFTQAIHPTLGQNFGNGSLSHTEEHLDQLVEMGCEFETLEVQTMIYTDLIESVGLSHLDLFVLDVEGHELSVLEGMRGCDVLPEVFCIEHGHLKEELYAAVESLGYTLDSTSFNNSFFVKR